MTKTDYLHKIILCRRATDSMQLRTQRQTRRILEGAYDDLSRILKLKSKDTLTYANYATRKQAIGDVLHQMTFDFNSLLRFSMKGASSEIVDIYSDLNEQYAYGEHGYKYDFKDAFATIPMQAVRNVTSRVYSDGNNFSQRLWKYDTYSKNAVNQIVSKGVARGQSAVSMAKELRRFLVDPSLTPGTTWTTAVTRSVKGRGTIHYNALRLARTEINNAYRESMVIANHKNPIMLGIKWNISANHPYPDVCDVWADVDLYGLGIGIHPADQTPIDHPNGRCYFTDAIRPIEDWGRPLEAAMELPLSQEQILRPVTTKSGIKEYQINAAWRVYNETKKLVSKERIRIRKAA